MFSTHQRDREGDGRARNTPNERTTAHAKRYIHAITYIQRGREVVVVVAAVVDGPGGGGWPELAPLHPPPPLKSAPNTQLHSELSDAGRHCNDSMRDLPCSDTTDTVAAPAYPSPARHPPARRGYSSRGKVSEAPYTTTDSDGPC